MAVVSRARPRLPVRWADLALVPVAVGIWLQVRRWAIGQPFWLDEQYIAANIRDRSYRGLAAALDYNQSAPLGWLWIERTILRVLGESERALRLPALAAGLGTLLLAWWIGRRWLGTLGAVVLTTACAVSPVLLRYSSELKPYAFDAFATVLLLALAASVIEASGAAPARTGRPRERPMAGLETGFRARRRSIRRPRHRRVGARRLDGSIVTWWAVATVMMWFTWVAVLATPGFALVLVVVAWRRGGLRATVIMVAAGLVWLASFAMNYVLVLRHAWSNPSLEAYWAPRGFPSEPYSATGLWTWGIRKLAELALDPIGVSHSRLFWLLVAGGVGVAVWARRDLAPLLLAPPATGFALAIARVTPLAGRLVLWLLPVLFVAVAAGVAASATAAGSACRAAMHRQRGVSKPSSTSPADRARPGQSVLAAVLGVSVTITLLAATAIVMRSPAEAVVRRPPPYSQGVDDRAGIRALTAVRRAGDIVLIQLEAWPAADWYADLRVLAPAYPVQARYPWKGCHPHALRRAVASYRRVVLYTGIHLSSRAHNGPTLRTRVAELGKVLEERSFGNGQLIVVDLHATPRVVGPPRTRANCVALARPGHRRPA